MAITGAGIMDISFSISRKGYDVDEVDVFLERVAEEVDALNTKISAMEEVLVETEAQNLKLTEIAKRYGETV